jgi:hypothetical protein
MIRPHGRIIQQSVVLGALTSALVVLLSCAPERPYHAVRVQVVAAGPIADAEVLLWWVDGDGHPLTKGGRRSRQAALSPGNALARGHTDQQGVVELPTGPAYGLVVLAARGGLARDPWVEAASDADAGAPCEACDAAAPCGACEPADGEPAPVALPVDIELRSVLRDFIPGPESRDVVISPLTTLAAAMGENRAARSVAPLTYAESMRQAFASLGAHFGGIDLARGPVPASADQPIPGLGATAMHVLALQGLAGLAHRIAEESGIAGRSFHTMDLLAGLLLDLGDSLGVFDGMSINGPVIVGACPVPDGCTQDSSGCRSICRLDASTLRARMASTLALDFIPAPFNRTTLSIADIHPFLDHLEANVDGVLFGGANPTKPEDDIDSAPPAIEVGSSTAYDERHDVVTFDEDAVPIHVPAEDALVDIGQKFTCPTVGKHIHRLADPDANPLRWHVVLRDRSGWRASGDPEVSLDYRVKQRSVRVVSDSRDAGHAVDSGDAAHDGSCDDDSGHGWLTGWLPAQPIGSVDDNGILFEVTLLRDRVPALAEGHTGELEIAFRGRDRENREVITCRCWNHVLLPAPLEIGELTVPMGPGSLRARSLHPGNNIAPLINGVPLDEAPALASFLVRNGTDQPGYLRFFVEQPLVHYTKCWRRTNAELHIVDDDLGCLGRGECFVAFPPDRQTIVAVDEGIIEHLITAIRVQDVLTQSSVSVEVCAGCDIPEHTIAPRVASAGPRTYRVDLLVSDLGVLAPRTALEPPALFFETVLEYPFLTSITGATAADLFNLCTLVDGELCREMIVHQYYRLLSAAELAFETPLSVRAAAVPLSQTSVEAAITIFRELESFAWSTHEQHLPDILRPSPPNPPQCPVAGGVP